MILFASAGFSARDAQAGENRGGIAAHKYAGLTSFQRTIPRMRKDCGVAAVCGRSYAMRQRLRPCKRRHSWVSARLIP